MHWVTFTSFLCCATALALRFATVRLGGPNINGKFCSTNLALDLQVCPYEPSRDYYFESGLISPICKLFCPNFRHMQAISATPSGHIQISIGHYCIRQVGIWISLRSGWSVSEWWDHSVFKTDARKFRLENLRLPALQGLIIMCSN